MKRLWTALLVVSCASIGPKPATPPPQSQPATPAGSAAPQPTPDESFRAQPPAPTAPVDFRAPVPAELTLKNGLRVFLIERHDVPLVAVSLAVRSGADTEPPGKAGLSSMALDLLDEGTPSRDAAVIARAFEDLGARYATGTD